VRQQAQSIYRKARLPGKTAFSAYFLEDLLATEAAKDTNNSAGSRESLTGPATARNGNGLTGVSERQAG
jgi:hypothetical protein